MIHVHVATHLPFVQNRVSFWGGGGGQEGANVPPLGLGLLPLDIHVLRILFNMYSMRQKNVSNLVPFPFVPSNRSVAHVNVPLSQTLQK